MRTDLVGKVVDGATTLTPARTIGWADRIGSLELGREADVAVLEFRAVGHPPPRDPGAPGAVAGARGIFLFTRTRDRKY